MPCWPHLHQQSNRLKQSHLCWYCSVYRRGHKIHLTRSWEFHYTSNLQWRRCRRTTWCRIHPKDGQRLHEHRPFQYSCQGIYSSRSVSSYHHLRWACIPLVSHLPRYSHHQRLFWLFSHLNEPLCYLQLYPNQEKYPYQFYSGFVPWYTHNCLTSRDSAPFQARYPSGCS